MPNPNLSKGSRTGQGQGVRGSAALPPFTGFIVQDTFTDVDTTLLSAHTPDLNSPGNPWALDGVGSIEIDTNRARCSSSSVHGAIDIGIATNYTIKTTMSVNTLSQSFGINFRWVTGSNRMSGLVNFNSSELHITQVGGAGSGVKARTPITLPGAAEEFDLELTVVGDQISLLYNGGNAISVNHSYNNTQTKVGIYFRFSGLDTYADNFTVAAPLETAVSDAVTVAEAVGVSVV